MTNLTIILACLSMIESGDKDRLIGKAGERSRWQITEWVWIHEAKMLSDFKTCAKAKWIAETAARKIIEARSNTFWRIKRRDPTPFETYVLWNAPAQIGHPSKVVSEKAQRFENLVRKMEKEKK